MPVLTERDIQYGFDCFHKEDPQPRVVREVAEYAGEAALGICCTQLDGVAMPQYKTAKAKKRVWTEWCDFLAQHPDAFEELTFFTRMPQALFDAVCHQRRLKKLHIKWGVYPDISQLAKLQQLTHLHLGSGAGVQSIDAIGALENLVALGVENLQKIRDYTPLARLGRLESLSIVGDFLGPQFIHVDSLDFLKEMPQLRYFRFSTTILDSKDLTPVLSLTQLEHLTLRSTKEAKALYPQLAALQKLWCGTVVEKPELFR